MERPLPEPDLGENPCTHAVGRPLAANGPCRIRRGIPPEVLPEPQPTRFDVPIQVRGIGQREPLRLVRQPQHVEIGAGVGAVDPIAGSAQVRRGRQVDHLRVAGAETRGRHLRADVVGHRLRVRRAGQRHRRAEGRHAAKKIVKRQASWHLLDRQWCGHGRAPVSGSARRTRRRGSRTCILRQIPARYPSEASPVVDFAPARILRRSATLIFRAQRGEFLESEPAPAAQAAQAGRMRGNARERRRRRRRVRAQCQVAPGRDVAHPIVIGAVRALLRGAAHRDHRRGDGGKHYASAPSRILRPARWFQQGLRHDAGMAATATGGEMFHVAPHESAWVWVRPMCRIVKPPACERAGSAGLRWPPPRHLPAPQ